jgi:uncharacterized membrane protein YdbT with pleckstrin-like domain
MSYLESLMSTGETVQLATRQHWVRIARTIVVNGLLVVVLGAVAFGAGAAALGGAAQPVQLLAGLLLLVPLALLVRDLSRWYSKLYVVTTRRVIEIEGVLDKVTRDSNLDKVNDVVLRQSALGRALGYGDIEIITGADIGVNHLEAIADPLGFKRTMLDNKEDFDSVLRLHEAVERSDDGDVSSAIERLGVLRDQGLVSPEEFERKKAELLARL